MNYKFIALAALTLFLALFYGFRRPERSEPKPIPSEADAPIVARNSEAPAPSAQGSTFQRIHEATPPDDPGRLFDPELFRSEDPSYFARVKKHLDIRYYLNSPARDTPESTQILELLKSEGCSTNAVGDAYNMAWDHANFLSASSQTGIKGHQEQYARIVHGVAEDRFKLKHGITNEAFFQKLFSIKPTVFFGLRNPGLPTPGEPLLE